MPEREVLDRIRESAASGRFTITRAFYDQLRGRDLTVHDVRHALSKADRCEPGSDGRSYTVTSTDLDGAEFVLCVTVAPNDVVVVS
jgi:hypothetical protein